MHEWIRPQLSRIRKHGAFLAVSWLGQITCRGLFDQQTLAHANDAIGNFMQTFGSIYGVIVAFVIFMVWQQHNETQLAIEREAVAMGELFRTLSWIACWPQRDAVRARLLQYAREVPLANADKCSRTVFDERTLLEESFGALLDYQPAAGSEALLHQTGLELCRQLSQARTHRLTVAALRLPDALRWFVFIGGVLMSASMWIVHVESLLVHSLLTAAMTWIVVGATSIIEDLNDPYTGDFIVDWDRFNAVASRMEALACPQPSPRGASFVQVSVIETRDDSLPLASE